MFCHIHVHSQYSMLESTISIDGLVDAASRMGFQALALTDKYVMHGAAAFYKKARARGIKPLLGCQICTLWEHQPYSLVLLCTNAAGYSNLCRMVSASHLQKKTPFPSLDLHLVFKNCQGLIALSCARQGHLSSLLAKGRYQDAQKALSIYRKGFGSRFYMEVQRYPKKCSQQGCLSETIIQFSQKNGVPLAAANDVHFTSPQDYGAYQALCKLKSMSGKSDPLKPAQNSQHYLKSAQEMESLFGDIPWALSHTGAIAQACRLKLALGGLHIPRFEVPCSMSQQQYLEKLCLLGLGKRYSSPAPALYRRLKKELDTIGAMRYSGYFLVVWDIARFARKNHIPICGKGSAAGSLVSYVLGISDVDPVKNNLYFERFLHAERKQPPDIDMDIAHKRREDVLAYVQSRYGEKNVGRVCSFSTLKRKGAVRESSRVLNCPKQETDGLLEQAAYEKPFPRSGNRDLLRLSSKLSGIIRHVGTHPSAIVVSASPLDETIPLMRSEQGKIMSQYDMDSIEALGILKIDLINSLSLTLIAEVSDSLSQHGKSWDIKKIRDDDPRTFAMMREGRTLGVFQLESTGIRNLMRKIRPASLEDITLLLSLYRPGPQQSGMVDTLIDRKLGKKDVYMHPSLKPLLEETYGVILYQEQVMRIARSIAGYSYGEADLLRKAMTKRSPQQMKEQKQRFIRGAQKKGHQIQFAQAVFSRIAKFASYGFLKAHASAYARISYAACYLKTHFPARFLAAVLSNGAGYYPPAQYIQEARRMGIGIKCPCINLNGFLFTAQQEQCIRVPLVQVKGLGPARVGSICKERERGGDFKNFTQFYRRCFQSRLSRAAVENLIKAGAFDFAAANRRKLLIYFWHLEKGDSRPDLGAIADFSLEEKLDAEKKILGFEVSASPLAFYRRELAGLDVTDSSNFRPGDVLCAGRVINRRQETDRNGNQMLFCTLEDHGGMYEAVFFPRAYTQNKKEVLAYPELLLKGRVCCKDSNFSVTASRAWGLKSLKKAKQGLKNDMIRNELISETSKLW